MGEQSLGAYRVTADTVAALLGKLSEQGIRSFFAMRTVSRCFIAVSCLNATPHPPRHSRGTELNIISDESLRQQKAENMRLRVKAVSPMPDNKKLKSKSVTLTVSTGRYTPTTRLNVS